MNKEIAFKILLAPRITEKSSNLGVNRKYVFKVKSNATKPEVLKDVEFLFEVKVDNVRICNMKSKKKNFGQRPGRCNAWKKAYVTLKEGHAINLGTA